MDLKLGHSIYCGIWMLRALFLLFCRLAQKICFLGLPPHERKPRHLTISTDFSPLKEAPECLCSFTKEQSGNLCD